MSEYFDMGGYAGYVWPSYALAALVMIGLVLTSVRFLRESERRLRQVQEARPRRRRNGTGAEPSGDQS